MKGFNKFLSLILCAVLFTACVSNVASADISYSASEKSQNVSQWCFDLEELFAKCRSLGITSVYDSADYEIVKQFSGRIATETDETKKDHYYNTLAVIYDRVRNNLLSYINGSNVPFNVVKKNYANITLKGGNLYSLVEQNGRTVEKPIVTGGYSSWQSTKEYTEFSAKLGSTTTEGVEYYQSNIVAFANGYLMENSYAGDEIKKITDFLDICETLNICLSFGYNTLYLPQGFIDYYNNADESEKIRHNDAEYSSYINFNPTHPAIKALHEKQAEILLPKLAKYKCITSIMMVNEPIFEANDKPYYYDKWTSYIKNLYGTIDALNNAYGTEYTSFDEVKMPLKEETTPIYYDYREFTTDILKEYFTNLKNIIKKHLPNMPVGVKLMEYTRATPNVNNSWNIKYDKYKDIFDVNYNDSFAFVDNDSLSIQGKMLWYDYLRSIINAPVINGENHVIEDKWNNTLNVNYDSRIPNHIAADMWQGAIHGSDQTVNWLLADNERVNTTYPNSTALYRPDLLSEISKTTLDMERLSDEITAIQDAPSDTAILYSDTSWNYDKNFTQNNYNAYLAVIYNGHKVKFVTERTLDNLSDQKVLIVPNCANTTPEAVQKIRAFVAAGGKVIFVGNDCLKKDRNNQSLSADILSMVNDLYVCSVTVDNISDLSDTLWNIYEEIGVNAVVVVDEITGRRVADTEWLATEIDGEYVVNICNYSETHIPDISIYINGKKAKQLHELRSNKTYNGTVELSLNKPLLLKIVSKENIYIYEPKNLIAVQNSSSATENIGINVSWVNPSAETLNGVTVYEHSDDGTDTFKFGADAVPGKVCEYRHTGLNSGIFKTYKVRFTFSDHSPIEVYTTGLSGKGEFKNLVSNVKNPNVVFTQRFGVSYSDGGLIPGVINKVTAEGENHFLDFRANVVDGSSTKAVLLYELDNKMEAGKKQVLSFKYKSATDVSCDIYIGTQEVGNKKSTMTIPTSNEWKTFSHTFVASWAAERVFLEFADSVERLCLDDITLYKEEDITAVAAKREFEYENLACTKGPKNVTITPDVNSAVIEIGSSDDWYISADQAPDGVARVVNYYNIYEVENGKRIFRARLARTEHNKPIPTIKLENLKNGKRYVYEVTCEDNQGVYESAAYVSAEVTPSEPYVISDFAMTNIYGISEKVLFENIYSASVNIINNSAPITPRLIVGLYSGGTMVNAYMSQSCTVGTGESKTLKIENIDLSSLTDNSAYIKCFLFKDLLDIVPLKEAARYSVIN